MRNQTIATLQTTLNTLHHLRGTAALCREDRLVATFGARIAEIGTRIKALEDRQILLEEARRAAAEYQAERWTLAAAAEVPASY